MNTFLLAVATVILENETKIRNIEMNARYAELCDADEKLKKDPENFDLQAQLVIAEERMNSTADRCHQELEQLRASAMKIVNTK